MQTGAPLGSEQDAGKCLLGNSRGSLVPCGLTHPQGTVRTGGAPGLPEVRVPPRAAVVRVHPCREQ